MPESCPTCGTQSIENARRCTKCGRSLLIGNHKDNDVKNVNVPDKFAATTHAFKLSDHIVSIMIGLVWGVIGFACAFFMFRRLIRRNIDEPIVWVALFIVGFCLPAAYGFYRSYLQDIEIKDREKNGLGNTTTTLSPYISDANVTSTITSISTSTDTSIETPHYARSKLGYIAGDYIINLNKLREWEGDVVDSNKKDDLQLVARLRRAVEKGDSQPAVVVVVNPDIIIVSAYSDKFDGYAFLGFTGKHRDLLVKENIKSVGHTLVCNWIYWSEETAKQTDILPGRNCSKLYTDGWPVLSDVLISDRIRLAKIKSNFGPEIYKKVLDGSKKHLTHNKTIRVRNGSPIQAMNQFINTNIVT